MARTPSNTKHGELTAETMALKKEEIATLARMARETITAIE